MMATPAELAVRALRKIKVLGANEAASAEDLALATQGVHDAHAVLEAQGLLRWTLQDIPRQVEVAYVFMTAYLIADDFVQVKDPVWMAQGMAQVQSHVYLPAGECSSSVEDF